MKTLWIILFCPIALFGQQLTGVIIDGDSHMPVDLATVYIDGTTVGCMTDSDGKFVLESPALSGKIVASHISYNTEVVSFENITNSNFTITLTPKVIRFEQVSKSGMNRREENLENFKAIFLGWDYWGSNAIIENDSVIQFKVDYYYSSELGQEKKVKSFAVEATAPLKISLPKLGYTLQYDLVHFTDKIDSILNRRVISTLGYFYYQPMSAKNKMVEREYRSNRMMAYYYSPQHFVRSLSTNKLLENGYLLYEQINDSINFFYLDSCNCAVFNSDGALITGMKGRTINFVYFKSKGEPVDLTRSRKFSDSKSSSIYFKDDVCVFRKNGSLPGGSVIFDRRIGIKKIGATLPSDYEPDKKDNDNLQEEGQNMHQELLKKVRL